jgi:carboxylesterase
VTIRPGPHFVDAGPYDLQPESPIPGVAALCVHGLSGTPYEVRPLAEAIAARGIRARGILLPGHGTTPETLARTGRDAWVTAVCDAYRRLRADHDRVFVVGLSLGGLLTLDLASREAVAGIVVVGTPLQLGAPVPQMIPLLKYVMPMLRKRGGSDIRDAEARARHPGYSVLPLASVHELVRLQMQVRSVLGSITAPALIAHGALDRTANPADANRIHDAIASGDRNLLMLADSGHVVPVDHDGARLAECVAEFVSTRTRCADQDAVAAVAD